MDRLCALRCRFMSQQIVCSLVGIFTFMPSQTIKTPVEHLLCINTHLRRRGEAATVTRAPQKRQKQHVAAGGHVQRSTAGEKKKTNGPKSPS